MLRETRVGKATKEVVPRRQRIIEAARSFREDNSTSGKVALKHDLMTTESDFSRAIGRLVRMEVQNPVQPSDDPGASSGTAACRND
jgi:hypothetical protein